MDAEQNGVDSWWGGAACSSSGPTISAVQFAWTADGPQGDDINYWDVVANNDGRTDYCDCRLQNFTDPNFSTGTRLQIKWYGTTSNGSRPQFDVCFKNAGVYCGPTTFSAPPNTATTSYFTLPSSRSTAQEILFRVYERGPNVTQRLHIYSVKLVP